MSRKGESAHKKAFWTPPVDFEMGTSSKEKSTVELKAFLKKVVGIG